MTPVWYRVEPASPHGDRWVQVAAPLDLPAQHLAAPREEPAGTMIAKPPRNHLPRGSDEHRALLLFGLDLVDRLGVPIVGIRSADHVGLSIQAECRHATEEIADALGLPPEMPDPDGDRRVDSYVRDGVTDVPGLAPRTVVLVYGPRDWDHWVWTGERSTCACGREIE